MMSLSACARALCRGFIGATMAAIIGAVFHGIAGDYSRSMDLSWGIVSVWAAFGFLVGALSGGAKLDERMKPILLGVPAGLIVGLVAAYVYALIVTDPHDPIFAGKFFNYYLHQALPSSIFAGVTLCSAAGWIYGRWKAHTTA